MKSEMVLLNAKEGKPTKTKEPYISILSYISGYGVEGKNDHFMDAKLSQPAWGHLFFLRDIVK